MQKIKKIDDRQLIITPQTKVADLIEVYPELISELIKMAPAFKKLKNPVLRRTIARITTLQQAARIGNVGVQEMVNTLRKMAGQDEITLSETETGIHQKPGWFDPKRMSDTLDAREVLAQGKEPLGLILKDAARLKAGEIYAFVTAFYPAPLIEKLLELNYKCWSEKVSEDLFRNYVKK